MVKFNNTQDIKDNDIKAKFDYIKHHFTYNTLNSWNGLKSIANNVKVYRLGLTRDQEDRYFDIMDIDAQAIIDYMSSTIGYWELDHSGYTVGFNGRSGGYLVLYNEDNFLNVIDEDINKYDTIDDMLEEYCNYYGCSIDDALVDYTPTINTCFELVKDFDILCDELLDQLVYVLDHATIEDEQITMTQQVIRID